MLTMSLIEFSSRNKSIQLLITHISNVLNEIHVILICFFFVITAMKINRIDH